MHQKNGNTRRELTVGLWGELHQAGVVVTGWGCGVGGIADLACDDRRAWTATVLEMGFGQSGS
jgi:hypothetical protein